MSTAAMHACPTAPGGAIARFKGRWWFDGAPAGLACAFCPFCGEFLDVADDATGDELDTGQLTVALDPGIIRVEWGAKRPLRVYRELVSPRIVTGVEDVVAAVAGAVRNEAELGHLKLEVYEQHDAGSESIVDGVLWILGEDDHDGGDDDRSATSQGINDVHVTTTTGRSVEVKVIDEEAAAAGQRCVRGLQQQRARPSHLRLVGPSEGA